MTANAHHEERARARLGARVLGRYVLQEVIGVGGVGVVFRATAEPDGRVVAVKALRDDILRVRTAAARFLREARIAQTLVHPAVPRGLDAGVDEAGAPVLVMEYIAGETIAALLAAHGPLPLADALRLGARVADALATAHRAGIVHRDIKPANLMLLEGQAIPDGVRVLDFGLAFCLDEPRLSATHGFVGSLEYMSPEQARGEVVSSASDLYALGATLAHLLTGETLYKGGPVQQIAGHARMAVPSLRARRPDLPRAVEHYLTAMLDKDPARRPVSAREVADTLEELSALGRGGSPSQYPPPLPPEGAQIEGASVSSSPGASSSPAATPARDELIEQLHACSSQLHHVTRAAAAAHAKMVGEIVEIGARRIERELAQREVAALEARGDAEGAKGARARLEALGDADADARREAALERAAAGLISRARDDEAEILVSIAELQKRLASEAPGGQT